MKARWTVADEKNFQRLLKRRRKAAKAVVAEFNPDVWDENMQSFAEDWDAQDMHENILNTWSPGEIAETFAECLAEEEAK